jgi:hypothetical protein
MIFLTILLITPYQNQPKQCPADFELPRDSAVRDAGPTSASDQTTSPGDNRIAAGNARFSSA